MGEVERAKEMARARIGHLPVEGRYHRLPRRLEDDYELLSREKLGDGCNGIVVLGRNRRTGVACAVKSFEIVGEKVKLDKYASEVGIYLTMDHPHVARLIAVYESETQISMIMECCEGGELFDRIQKQVFTEEEAAQAVWQMLLAINYLHSEGVVHRDLKLENFVYERKGGDFLKMIDFGFSKLFPKSTEMQESLGTAHYVAPEVLEKSYAGGSCDMWSLGVIVFVLLAGYMPFNGKSDKAICRAIRLGKVNMNTAQWSHISESAQDFVKRLLVREPCNRMTAAAALQHPWLAQRGGVGKDAPSHGLTSIPTTLAGSIVAGAFVRFARATRFQQACMQMMAWILPAEERRLLRDTFLDIDTMHAGVFRFDQLDQLLEKGKVSKLDREAVRETMASWDIDQDGDMHYSDFLAVMMAPRLTQGECATVEEVFWRFDVEGLGYLTEEGLWQSLGMGVSRSEVKQIFSVLDVDADGKIHLKEFVSYLRKELAAS